MKLTGKKTAPYRYLAPTILLMIVFMVIPICMVIGYSFVDKAVVSQNPQFIGLENYKTIFADNEYIGAISNTIIFVVVSVVAHLILGMLFAMLLNSKYFKSRTKTIARVIYILPWVFTASVVAILWKLMLQPSGIVNYLLSIFPQISRIPSG